MNGKKLGQSPERRDIDVTLVENVMEYVYVRYIHTRTQARSMRRIEGDWRLAGARKAVVIHTDVMSEEFYRLGVIWRIFFARFASEFSSDSGSLKIWNRKL